METQVGIEDVTNNSLLRRGPCDVLLACRALGIIPQLHEKLCPGSCPASRLPCPYPQDRTFLPMFPFFRSQHSRGTASQEIAFLLSSLYFCQAFPRHRSNWKADMQACYFSPCLRLFSSPLSSAKECRGAAWRIAVRWRSSLLVIQCKLTSPLTIDNIIVTKRGLPSQATRRGDV